MAKIVLMQRFGNEPPFAEGNEGKVIEESSYQVSEELHAALLTSNKVTSKWTGNQILQDGAGPDYKDASGADRLLSDIFESNNMTKNPTPDLTLTFTAADYGYQDDFSTDLP